MAHGLPKLTMKSAATRCSAGVSDNDRIKQCKCVTLVNHMFDFGGCLLYCVYHGCLT